MVVDGWLVLVRVFEFPGILPLIVEELGRVISFVEILEDGGEYFGLFIRQIDSTCGAVIELPFESGPEIGRAAQNVFVAGKESLLWANAKGDNR